MVSLTSFYAIHAFSRAVMACSAVPRRTDSCRPRGGNVSNVSKQTQKPKPWRNEMTSVDLSVFRRSAAAMRSGTGFEGDFLRFSGESGKWSCGKENTDVAGRRIIADVTDMLVGWQKFKDKRPVQYGGGRIIDGHQLPPRSELDEQDEAKWRNSQDPWQVTYYLAAFDDETGQTLIFTTSSRGGKDWLAGLQDEFAIHNDGRPPTEWQWPRVELTSESYINSYGKKFYAPIFRVLEWCDPPANFKAIRPPAST